MKTPLVLPNLVLAAATAAEWDMVSTIVLKHMPIVSEHDDAHAFESQ